MFHAAERNEGTVRFNTGFLLELSLCSGELILSRTDFPFRNKPGSLVLLSPKRILRDGRGAPRVDCSELGTSPSLRFSWPFQQYTAGNRLQSVRPVVRGRPVPAPCVGVQKGDAG